MNVLTETDTHMIETDGRTLWVNGPGLLGRFSPTGMDVHVHGKCMPLTCSFEPDWVRFVELMIFHHQIDVESFKKELTWLNSSTAKQSKKSESLPD